MWFIVWELVILIASVFIQKALTPATPATQPQAAGTFEKPTADSSRAIPVVFGTCKVTGGNVLWFGETSAVPHYEATGGGNQAITAYSYLASIDLGVCHGPVDSLSEVLINDKAIGIVNMSPVTVGGVTTYTLAQYTFYDQTCGLFGKMESYLGAVGQPTSAHMQSACSADYPGLSSLCHLVFISTVWGSSPYVSPVSVVVTRCPNTLGLTSNHHKIASVVNSVTSYDANPACMLYELLTDTTWGLGIDPSNIDLASFQAVGNTLWATPEQFGLSMVFDTATPATDLIREVLRHIDGGLTTHPTSGKLMLKLIRADYVIGDLPVLDESCIDEVEFSRKSWCETANTVRINFLSWADNWTDRIAQWQNLANQQVVGVTTLVQIDYKGCSNAHTAGLVAARVMKLSSYPFAAIRFKANRLAWGLRQCDVFVLNWPPLGISGMVCRVTKPAAGQLEDGMMTLECVEDAFAIGNTAFSEVGPSLWSPPSAPTVVAGQRLWEAPGQLSLKTLNTFVPRDAWALAAIPAGGGTGFQVWSDPAGGTAYTQTGGATGFTPSAALVSSYAENTAYVDSTGFQVNSLTEADRIDNAWGMYFNNVQFRGLLLIDNEVMGYTGVSGTGATRTLTGIWRGLFDTVPAAHSAAAAVWFILHDDRRCQVTTGGYYSSNLTLTAKLLTTAMSGVMPIASASQISLALTGRGMLQPPPGNVKINATSWLTTMAHTVDAVVTWARRDYNALAYGGICAGQGDADYPNVLPANDQVYKIEVRVSGTLVRTVTAIAATTWTWTQAMQATDCSSVYGKTVSIRVSASNVGGGSLGGYQERTFTIT